MSLSKKVELGIFERDKNTCQGCKRVLPTKFSVVHPTKENYLVVDHRDGRSNDPSNLQSLCVSCNSSKSGRGASSFELHVALKKLGQCVAYYPSLSRIMGIKESIFLCQLIYWTPKGRHEKGDGWIYKSVEEMDEETGLSYKEQIRVRKSLIDQGLLEENYDRNEHRLYFRVLADGLNKKGDHLTNGHMPKGKMALVQKSDGTLPKVSSYKEQEITQETTQEHHKAVVWLASRYREIFGFDEKTWTLTDARKKKALTRLAECLKKTDTLNGAIGMMLLAVKTCRASRFHMGENDRATKFISWEKNIFHSQEQLEDWITKGTKQRTITNPQNDPMQLMRQQRGIVDAKA